MNNDPIWFYEKGGERCGPVMADVLSRLQVSGEIGGTTLVWRDGLPDWIAYSESELAGSPQPKKMPPSMPPVLSSVPPTVPKTSALYTPRPARLRADFRPRLRETYGRAWNHLTSRFWPFVGCFALTSILLGVASQLYAPIFFLMFPLMGGLYWYYLLPMRGKESSVETLFEGFQRQFGPLAILNLIVVGISTVVFLLVSAVLIVGLVMGAEMLDSGEGERVLPILLIAGSVILFFVLMIPMLVFSLIGFLATLLSLDCGLSARESLSLAWVASRPHLGKLTLFAITNMVLSLLGMVALYFGMFITGAWSTIAFVQLYEDAFGDEPSR